MAKSSTLTRFLELPRERRAMLLRAMFALTAASTAVALLPFRTAVAFGSSRLKRRIDVTPEDCVWAVEAAARRLPWRTMCIEKGLCAQRLLRQGGLNAILHYGARHTGENGALEAHVWVSVAGDIVIGGDEAPDFAEVAAFP
jgi:hypothetical protein